MEAKTPERQLSHEMIKSEVILTETQIETTKNNGQTDQQVTEQIDNQMRKNIDESKRPRMRNFSDKIAKS